LFLRIETQPKRLFVGKKLTMSLVDNKTQQLWKSFMLLAKNISNRISSDFISLQNVSAATYFQNFVPIATFEKRALVEVSSLRDIPEGMEAFELAAGEYAVFQHKGLPNEISKTMQFILGEWLPNSIYELDNRPYFEVLGEKYYNNSETSEEEVWMPVVLK